MVVAAELHQHEQPEFVVEQRTVALALGTLKRALRPARLAPLAVSVVAESGRVRLAAEHDGVGLCLSLDAKIDRDGETVVDLEGALRAVQRSGTVRFAGSQVIRGTARLSVSSHGPASAPENRPRVVSLEIEASILRQLLVETAFAMSVDETRPHLCGLALEADGVQLHAVATDGHRLAASSVGSTARPFSVLLRDVGVAALQQLVTHADGAVRMAIGQDRVWFTIGEHLLAAPLVTEANFPAWRHVVPRELPTVVQVARGELATVVTALVPQGTGAISFEVRADGVIAACSDNGEAEAYGRCAGHTPVRIAFNGRYLREALAALASYATVEWAIADPLDPAVLRAGDAIVVVMPMRL